MSRLKPWAGGAAGTALLAWESGVDDWVMAAKWSPDGQWLAAASASGLVRVFDGATGSVQRGWAAHGTGTTTLSWSADGALLATGGQDGAVRVWDPARDEPIVELEAGADWVERVAFSPVGQRLATAAGRTLRLFSLDGTVVRAYSPHGSTISDVAWKPVSHTASASSLRLTSAGYGGIAIFATHADEPVRRFEWIGSILRIAWSPDARYVATGDQDRTVHFWIVKQNRDLQMWGYPRKVTALAWDRTSRFLATNGSAQVSVWDCSGRGPEGTEPHVLSEHTSIVTALAFQRRGPVLVSGGEDGRTVLWEPGRIRRPLWRAQYGGEVACVAWSPQEDTFAAGYGAGAVRVFRVGPA